MSLDIHSEHNEFRMDFRIEQKPDGTFVGICDKPHMEITGATREEIMQKIKDSLGSRLLDKLGMAAEAAAEGSGIQIKVNKKFTITKTSADGTKTELFSTSSSSPAEISGSTPITSRPIDAPGAGAQLMKWVIGLAVLLGMAWWFLHR